MDEDDEREAGSIGLGRTLALSDGIFAIAMTLVAFQIQAPNLHGSLLISHGTSDDNVHMANTIAMLDALAAAGKTRADFYAYARQKHGFTSLADLRRLYTAMLAWWKAHL